MKFRWLLLFALAWMLRAQPAFLAGPKVANISHGSVRVVWVTDSHPTSSEIEWGPTTSYGNVRPALRWSASPYSSTVVLSGLAPGTTYHCRARLNGGAVVSGDVTFTTAAEPSPHPVLPLAPAPRDVSLPAINGNTYTIDAACSNLASTLTTLAGLTGSANHELVIPAGITCYGTWNFPARPNHTGWVVVRSSAVGTSSFPPEGVRWTKNWPVAATLATLVTRALGTKQRTLQQSLPSGTCVSSEVGQGGFHGVVGLPASVMPLLRCSDSNPAYTGATLITAMTGSRPVIITAPGHTLVEGQVISIPSNGYIPAQRYLVYDASGDTFKVYVTGSGSYTGGINFGVINIWRHPPVTKSASNPTAGCVAESWWYNTSSGGLWWCVSGAWVEFISPGHSEEEQGAINVVGARYRFIGLEITSQQVPGYPSSYPAGWATVATSEVNLQGLVLALGTVSGEQVVFDRCYIHGQPKPARVRKGLGIYAGGSAILESYFEHLQEWKTGGYPANSGSNALTYQNGDGHLIRNNCFETPGIVIFSTNGVYDGAYPQASNVVIQRNTFKKLAAWRRTDTQPFQYPNRHAIELKAGERWLIEGNQFDYNWSGVGSSPQIRFAPRTDSISGAAVAIASFSNGVLTLAGYPTYSPGDVIYISGTDTAHNGLQEVAANGCPSNCLQVTLSGSFSGSGSGGAAYLRAPGRTMQDLEVRHNSFYQGTELLRYDGTDGDATTTLKPALKRLRGHNNLSVDMNIRSYAAGGRVDKNGVYAGGYSGAIFAMISNGDTEDTRFTHNTVYGNWGNMPMLLSVGNNPNEGLLHSDNLMTFDESGFDAIRRGTSEGEAALNAAFVRDGAPYWRSENNLLCCGKPGSAYPATYTFPAAQGDVKWLLPTIAPTHNLRLRYDSPYVSGGAARASDDTDVGADLDALEAAQGRVRNVRVWGLTPASANLGYLAPDAQACMVEVGPSATWGTGTRWPDGGGDRARRLSLTGLSSLTVYHYRILCAVEQPSGSFRTP